MKGFEELICCYRPLTVWTYTEGETDAEWIFTGANKANEMKYLKHQVFQINDDVCKSKYFEMQWENF